jgi:hypothetical protein
MDIENLIFPPSSPGAYQLLNNYLMTAKVLSSAYKHSSGYHRRLYQYLTYPLILTSAISTVLSGFQLNEYAVMGLSLTSLLLVGFNSATNPKDRENKAHNFSIEYSEVASDIEQFILENNKTKEQIKTYSQHINSVLNIFKSQSPTIRDSFLKQAKLENSPRIRSSLKKKETTPESHV